MFTDWEGLTKECNNVENRLTELSEKIKNHGKIERHEKDELLYIYKKLYWYQRKHTYMETKMGNQTAYYDELREHKLIMKRRDNLLISIERLLDDNGYYTEHLGYV